LPNWGKVVEWSDLEYTLTGSASASGSGGVLSYGYAGSCFTSYAFNTVLIYTGISLEVESSFDGTSGTWSVKYDGPGAPFGGYIVTGSTYSSVSISARIKNLKIYQQLTGCLFNVSWDEIEIYVNGSLSTTLAGSGVNETSTGVGPNYVPLIGVPLQVASSVTGGIDQPPWTYDECDPEDVPDQAIVDVAGVITAGMRFKELSGGGWQSLPIYLDVRTVSCGGCPFSLVTTGLVGGSSTDAVTLNPYLKTDTKKEYDQRIDNPVIIRVICYDDPGNELDFNDYVSTVGDYTLLCDGTPILGAVVDWYKTTAKSESGSSSICIVPNLQKIINRIGHDTLELVYRTDLPLVTGAASRAWTIDATSGSSSSTPTIFSGSLPFLGAMGQTTHPMEDYLALNTPCPLTVSRSKTESVTWEEFFPTPVDEGTHPPPDFNDPAQCPEGTVRIGVTTVDTIPDLPAGSFKTESVSWTSVDFVDSVANYQGHASALLRYLGTYGNLLWHYLHFKDNYSTIDWEDYWGPSRQQHLSNAALPDPSERRFTRTCIIGSCWNNSGHQPFMDERIGHLFLGTHRPIYKTPTIPASCQTSASSSSRWNFGDYDSGTDTWDGTGTVGASTVQITTTTKATLDVLSFTSFPFMYPLICDRIEIPNTFTNVASFEVHLIGLDGSEVLLTDTVGTFTIPKGPSTDYAGSWLIENSPGAGISELGIDLEPNDLSSVVMSSARDIKAFSLLCSRSFYRLRFTVVKTNPAIPCEVPHPIFKRTSTVPKMIWESGHCQTLIYANGPMLRLGNWTFYIDGVGLQNPPVIGTNKPTIIDALCWSRLVLEARAHDDGLTTELSAMFDTLEGQSVAVVDKFSMAWVTALAGEDSTSPTYQLTLINNMAQAPPLSCFPNKSEVIGATERSKTGPYNHEVWIWSQERRRLVTSGGVPAHIFDNVGTMITANETGFPAGWSGSAHRLPVDNTEIADFEIRLGGTTWSTIVPWRGHVFINGLSIVGDLLGLRMCRDDQTGFLHAVLPCRPGVDLWSWDETKGTQRIRTVTTDETKFASIAWSRETRRLVVVFDQLQFDETTDIMRTETDSRGLVWDTPVMLWEGKGASNAFDAIGREFVSYWHDGKFRCRYRKAQGQAWQGPFDVFTSSDAGATAIEIGPFANAPVVIITTVILSGGGTEVRRFESTSSGRLWVETT
jgi:hypothetical protein